MMKFLHFLKNKLISELPKWFFNWYLKLRLPDLRSRYSFKIHFNVESLRLSDIFFPKFSIFSLYTGKCSKRFSFLSGYRKSKSLTNWNKVQHNLLKYSHYKNQTLSISWTRQNKNNYYNFLILTRLKPFGFFNAGKFFMYCRSLQFELNTFLKRSFLVMVQ